MDIHLLMYMRIHRLIRAVCALAEEEIGRERADRIARAAQRSYKALCKGWAGKMRFCNIFLSFFLKTGRIRCIIGSVS